MKGNPDVLPIEREDNDVVLFRSLLRDAIERSGWKHEAVAAAMSEKSGLRIDGPYLSKLLAGEKTLTARHICSLPDDIEARFEGLRAESFGAIVVTPPASGAEAVHHLVAGLVGLLAPRPSLPEKADRMARAAVKPIAAKAAT
jgi:hypothetical protein